MPLFFLGTREWRNRQTRTVQVRVPVMEWGFNSPLAHDETADPFRICGFCFPWLLLVAPRVFRAPRGLSRGPGCLMPPWAAARPRAVRAASLRLGASPRSPARPCRRPRVPQPGPPASSGALHTSGAVSLTLFGSSSRSPARPRHRPRAPQPGPAALCGRHGGLAC